MTKKTTKMVKPVRAKKTKKTKVATKKTVKPVKTVRKARVTVPTLDLPEDEVVPEVDLPSKPDTVRLVAKRIWFCLERRSGCKGLSPFLGWEQLLDAPTCPNCGAGMNWHQWGEKHEPKSMLRKRPTRKTTKNS